MQKKTDSIVDINKEALLNICKYLKIDTPIVTFSEMKLEIEEVKSADEWALNICKALNATSYINPIGGQSFFDAQKYLDQGICIHFLEFLAPQYQQLGQDFVPFLSIIDVMMFNSVEVVNEMLCSFTLE